jgi:hypothetical protein
LTILEKNTKPILAIEYLPNEPRICLEKFWADKDINELMNDLNYYFFMALSHTGTGYAHYTDIRAAFVEFFSHLQPFVEAMYCLNISESYLKTNGSRPDAATTVSISAREDHYSFYFLNENKIVDHVTIISDFCRKYSLPYLRREIYDFVNAAIWYQGPLLEHVSPHMFIENFHSILTLVETAHALQIAKS